MVCSLRALLCLSVCVCVYLICLISVGRSVCLYSLHFAGSRLPPPGSVLACPVQSCPVLSTWQSSAHPVVSSLLVWSFFLSKPPHLPSLTFFHPPLKTRPRGRVQHSTAPHTINPAGSAPPYRVLTLCSPPLLASIRRAATFPESTLVPEASFWRQQQYVSTRTCLSRPSQQPFKLYIGFRLACLVCESSRGLQPA